MSWTWTRCLIRPWRCLGRVMTWHGRWIPFTFATIVLLACLAPLYTDRVDARIADLYTLPLASAVFAFMAAMFFWIRHRMVTDPRPMTAFGRTVIDFFTAHIVLAVVWAVVYGVLFWYAWQGRNLPPGTVRTPMDVRTINRATIISGGALIVATGVAFAVRMRRAGAVLTVHEEGEAWDGEERRSGRDRRTGWGKV